MAIKADKSKANPKLLALLKSPSSKKTPPPQGVAKPKVDGEPGAKTAPEPVKKPEAEKKVEPEEVEEETSTPAIDTDLLITQITEGVMAKVQEEFTRLMKPFEQRLAVIEKVLGISAGKEPQTVEALVTAAVGGVKERMKKVVNTVSDLLDETVGKYEPMLDDIAQTTVLATFVTITSEIENLDSNLSDEEAGKESLAIMTSYTKEVREQMGDELYLETCEIFADEKNLDTIKETISKLESMGNAIPDLIDEVADSVQNLAKEEAAKVSAELEAEEGDS